MKVLKSSKEYSDWLSSLDEKTTIGVAPTMGNIHDAHLSLLAQALKDNDKGVITIFVNPTQFGEDEDFESYPRTLQNDIDKIATLETMGKEIIIFAPKNNDIYPENFNQYIQANEISCDLEGALRPTHFDGVVTVVNRLFDITKPTSAYFGKKDYQQLKLIELMANQYHPKTTIVAMPILREENGLAMSSRNNYLSREQKQEALILKQTLESLKEIIQGTKSLKKVENKINQVLKEDSRFNYLSIKSLHDFKEVKDLNQPVVILGNFQMNQTRLLDNLEVNI